MYERIKEFIKSYFFFWGECISLSFWSSWDSANNLAGAVVVSLLLFANGTLPLLKETSGNTELIRWENGALTLIFYTIIAYIVIYFLRIFFVVPFHFYRKIWVLQKQLKDREKRQATINKLWDLRASGSHLRNMHIEVKTQKDYGKWKADYEQWRVDILREADVVSPNLQRWNHVVQQMNILNMPAFESPYNTNPEFIINYRIICDNLNRIDKYLQDEIFLEQQQYYVTR